MLGSLVLCFFNGHAAKIRHGELAWRCDLLCQHKRGGQNEQDDERKHEDIVFFLLFLWRFFLICGSCRSRGFFSWLSSARIGSLLRCRFCGGWCRLFCCLRICGLLRCFGRYALSGGSCCCGSTSGDGGCFDGLSGRNCAPFVFILRNARERPGQRLHTRKTVLWLFLETFRDNKAQAFRHIVHDGVHRFRRLLNVLQCHADWIVCCERQLADKHFIEHNAEGIDICLIGQLFTTGLLRREIMRRAQHALVVGDGGVVHHLGNAKVGDLDIVKFIDEDVLAFHILVDDLVGVRVSEPIGDLHSVFHSALPWDRAIAVDLVLEGLPFHIFHN